MCLSLTLRCFPDVLGVLNFALLYFNLTFVFVFRVPITMSVLCLPLFCQSWIVIGSIADSVDPQSIVQSSVEG
jgi:hypothetical protein